MKKTIFVLLTLVLVLVGCGQANKPAASQEPTPSAGASTEPTAKEVTLTVGATPTPHAIILNFIKPKLKEQGINLEVKEFTDYAQINTQLAEKNIDANYFQHIPYLEDEIAKRQYPLVNVGGIHVEPFGLYSNKITAIGDLKDGAKIAIPNDATNGGRALLLLAANNLITLPADAGNDVTVAQIAENPHNFVFVELEAAMLPRTLDEVDAAAINTNYALEAKLDPAKDALIIESKDSPNVNIIVAREDNKDDEAIKKLVEALQTEEVREFILNNFEGVVPVF